MASGGESQDRDRCRAGTFQVQNWLPSGCWGCLAWVSHIFAPPLLFPQRLFSKTEKFATWLLVRHSSSGHTQWMAKLDAGRNSYLWFDICPRSTSSYFWVRLGHRCFIYQSYRELSRSLAGSGGVGAPWSMSHEMPWCEALWLLWRFESSSVVVVVVDDRQGLNLEIDDWIPPSCYFWGKAT